jgi:hypothetical protein
MPLRHLPHHDEAAMSAAAALFIERHRTIRKRPRLSRRTSFRLNFLSIK